MQHLWQHNYDRGVPLTVDYANWTVLGLFYRAVERFSHSSALYYYGKRITFGDLDQLSRRFADALRTLGVHPGDRVAIMLPNTPQAIIGYLGAMRAGAVVVWTNPLYTAPEIEAQLADSGSETLLVLDLFYPRVAAVYERTPLKRIITTCLSDFFPLSLRVLYPIKARFTGRWVKVGKHPLVHDLLTLLKHAPISPNGDGSELFHPQPEDLALLQYTGGTTGISKGVMLTHRNLVANTLQCHAWVPDFADGQEIFLGVIPYFHSYGLSTTLNLALMGGCEQILLPRFQVVEVMRAIERHRVTIFSGIPAMFTAVSESDRVSRYNLRSLRVCLSGANPLPADVQDRFERLTGVSIAEGYGLTEASPVTHCNPVHGTKMRGSVGVPFPDTECRIMDMETGSREVAEGEIGELTVRGPQDMQGYWNKEKETRTVLRDGWLHTGDIASRDAEGFYYLMDRKKDMIKTRGENVYPREVEEVLFKHPAIVDAVVVGIPDRKFGEIVKAYVVLRNGLSVTETAITEHCRQSLARFKVPTAIEFRPELPRTLVGKVLRRALREEEVGKTQVEQPQPSLRRLVGG